MPIPPPEYDHLLALIDDTAIYEHARYGVPRREHGYTVDDATRALVVLCLTGPREDLEAAQRTLLSFLLSAVTPEGRLRNRLSFERRWVDDGDCDDTHGRGIWALAVAAVHAGADSLRSAARSALEGLTAPGSPHLRPRAYAALGAHALWLANPDDPLAGSFASPARALLPGTDRAWPESRLTYGNGRIPAALIAAGEVLDDEELIAAGLHSLEWLVDVETADNHLSFTPVGGWEPGDPRPGFDQQPIEVAALSDACERAWRHTGDPRWSEMVTRCGAWLMGDNDRGVAMYDPRTGATFDGLMGEGVNENSGAESTIAGLATLQACARIGAVFEAPAR